MIRWDHELNGNLVADILYHNVRVFKLVVIVARSAEPDSLYTVRIVNAAGEIVEEITGYVGEVIATQSAGSMARVMLRTLLEQANGESLIVP